MATPKVAIIGAGLAGLCCARRLFQCGIPFEILEASDAVGGRVRTDRVDGFLLDRGFQIYLTAYPEGRRVLDLEALNLRYFSRGAKIWTGRRFEEVRDPREAPLTAMLSLFNQVGGVLDKFRIADLAWHLSRTPLLELWRQPERPTRDFLRWNARFSEKMIQRLFEPFFGGVFLERELVTSSRLFAYLFRMFAEGPGAVPAGGMQAIPEQIAAGLPARSIRFESRVVAIDGQELQLADGSTVSAPVIVIAVDGSEAARLAGSLLPELAWRGSTTVYYATEQAPMTEPILHLDGTGTGPVNSVVALSLAAPEYAPPGQTLLSAAVIGVPEEKDEELDRKIRAQFREWFGPSVANWRRLRIDRIRQALPDQSAGRLDPWQRPVRLRPGLYVCGDHRDQGSIDGAMTSGFRTAQTVMHDLAEFPAIVSGKQ